MLKEIISSKLDFVIKIFHLVPLSIQWNFTEREIAFDSVSRENS